MFHTANPGPENGPVMHLALLAQTALGGAAADHPFAANHPDPQLIVGFNVGKN
jgi:hypothetical protein